ncbi:protein transport protein HofC [Paramixta manurensis]
MTSCTLYRWQALDARGDRVQGELLVQPTQQVITLLLTRDYAPLNCTRGRRYRARDWRQTQKITFLHQLSTLLRAGITLSESLKQLGENHAHPGWRALLTELHREVAQGVPFSQALARWPMVFSPLFPALMQVGELTGQLTECCARLAQQQERQQQLQKKVIKALRYPLFILCIALAVTAGMLLFVLPEFVTIYRAFNAPLPAFTALVMQLSSGLQQLALPMLLASVASGVLWRYQRKRSVAWQRREQRLLLRLPLISRLWRGSQLSQIFTTLTLTQRAGLTLLQGLEAVEKTVSGQLWREAIHQLQQHIASGLPLHQALVGHTLFTPLCYQLVKVGEESGALEELLARLAQWHQNHTDELADTLAATLEPLMMVVIGGIVGTLVIAMYLPIFGLGDALG